MPLGLPRAPSAAALAAAVGLLFASCGEKGPPKRLEGSLSTLLDLRYDQAYLDSRPEEAALRFVKSREAAEDTVLQVTVNLTGAALEARTRLDLAEPTPTGAQRGVVTRSVENDPRTRLPRLSRGGLTLHRSAISGEPLTGELHLTFENGTEFGSGRTVFGTFEALVP